LAAAEWELALAGSANVLAEYREFEWARLLGARGEYAAAAERAAALRKAYPGSPLAGRLAALEGDNLAALGREAEARQAWTLALGESENPVRRRALGLALIESRQRSGELDSAVAAESLLELVLPQAQGQPGAGPAGFEQATALARAEALRAEGRSALAIEAYREALLGELEPEQRRDTRFQLGVALFRLREYGESLSVFDSLGADSEARLWYARSLARRGRLDEAIEVFEEVAAEANPPISIRASYLAATLLEDQVETERAMAHYALIADDRDHPSEALQALWRIAWSAWRRGDYVEARHDFQRTAEREPDPIAALKPRYWAARAVEAMGRGRTGRNEMKALARDWPLSYYGWRAQQRLGENRVRARPSSPVPRAGATEALDEARLYRALLLFEAGYVDSVRRELEPLASGPCAVDDCVRLGSLLVGVGDYHRAQQLVVGAYPGFLGQGIRAGYEALFWLSWPPAYADLVRTSLPESERVDPALVWAIMREESGFRPGVMSSAGAMGLLQLMPETARRTAARMGAAALEDSEMLFAPATNIALGSAYLDYLAERFPGQTSAVIASYNAGPAAVASWRKGAPEKIEDDVWVEEIPYAQTRSYVRRVLRSLHAYRRFY
jgi:soluble lytic murein transglycosylase